MKTYLEKTLGCLPPELAAMISNLPEQQRHYLQEIRLRVNRPVSVVVKGQSLFVPRQGEATPMPDEQSFVVSPALLEDCFVRLCGYSVHSHTAEIAKGFVTTEGGDRAGVCANVIEGENGTVAYRDISSINLRIAREAVGCARGLLRLTRPRKGILIAGMPAAGKTTLLRDMVRSVASGELGEPLKVAVVDERHELSAMRRGVPGFELGLCSDVICGLAKAAAIEQAVRTLSPDIIACDEIGSQSEIEQLNAGLRCGAAFFATVHCGGRTELVQSTRVRSLMDTGAFGYIALLDSPRFPTRASFIFTVEEYYAKACGIAAAV